jgi:hypothetical protein
MFEASRRMITMNSKGEAELGGILGYMLHSRLHDGLEYAPHLICTQ